MSCYLFRMTIADYLKKTEQTQEELAEKLGITRQMVSQLVRGTERPGLDLAVRIQKLCGIKVESWVAE